MKLGNYSMNEGVCEALGYDKMILPIFAQKNILDTLWNFGIDRSKGYTDPRYGLAAACAGWEKEIAIPFLLHCMESQDVPLKYVASKSLERKYVKLR